MINSNEDHSICARCGGHCCRTRPGIEGPERFLGSPDPAAALAQFLGSGNWVLEQHLGVPYQPGETAPDPERIIRYPRPATVLEHGKPGLAPLPDTADCVFLAADGCYLPFNDRPRLCRELVPDICLECESPWGRREAALAWLNYQEIIEQALKQLTNKRTGNHPMSSPLILVISRSETRVQVYREALESIGASCLATSDLKNAPVLAASTPMNGIAIDMPVRIKASSNDKALVEDMLLALPSVYLNVSPATDTIKILTATGTKGTFRTFEQFVAACANFQARVVRPKNRVELNLNALLYHDAASGVAPEQTVTLNVSPEGCFLFSTHPDIEVNQQIVIDFVGLTDRTPIMASVRWLQTWGKDNLIPGIGVMFVRLSKAQRIELQALLKALEPG